MPELPEVETVRIQLQHAVVNKVIEGVEIFHTKTVGGDASFADTLLGKEITYIDRIGKLLIFSFSKTNDVYLLAHLKMTGQFFYVEDGEVVTGGGHSDHTVEAYQLPDRHTRVGIHFADGSSLYFNDMRLFGYMKVVDGQAAGAARRHFGPEPIASDFDCEWFVSALRKRKTSVKAVLLDQKFVAGLGNIYVDEALWRASIRPDRRADRVTKKAAAALCAAAGDVMRESIALGGTTFRNFVDTGGQHGNFKDKLAVFGRHGQPCLRCGQKIIKNRVAGRGTHYCPRCQK